MKCKTAIAVIASLGCMLPVSAMAQDQTADDSVTLDELLEQVRTQTTRDQQRLRQREKEFAQARDRQQALLAEAKAERERLENRSSQLEATFDDNKQQIEERQQDLDEKLGNLKELFGVFQQTAGDLQGTVRSSAVSAQYPGRHQWLETFAERMSRASEISTVEDIETLWYELQREMTATGKVVRFESPVLLKDGSRAERDVIRLGGFGAVMAEPEPRYLAWRAKNQNLAELQRQPADRYLDMLNTFAASEDESSRFGLDPTGGSLLERLVQSPTLRERIDQGGLVGYIILAVGFITLLVALERIVMLAWTSAKVNAQCRDPHNPDDGNPLGRVLNVFHANRGIDSETLEMKLGEAVMRETPKLNRALTFLKIVAVAAPLMGLLGTVTGMINTFQAITLFGTGDPKTMAGGISQALVTTVLGLTVAIPTVFLHSIAQTRARSIIHMLQEQSAGLIAEYMEGGGKSARDDAPVRG